MPTPRTNAPHRRPLVDSKPPDRYLIHAETRSNDANVTIKPRFAHFYRDSFEAEGFRLSGFAQFVAEKMNSDGGALTEDESITGATLGRSLSHARLRPVDKASASFGHQEETPTEMLANENTRVTATNAVLQIPGMHTFCETVEFGSARWPSVVDEKAQMPYALLGELLREVVERKFDVNTEFYSHVTPQDIQLFTRRATSLINELKLSAYVPSATRAIRAGTSILTTLQDVYSYGKTWENPAVNELYKWKTLSPQELQAMETLLSNVRTVACEEVTSLVNKTIDEQGAFYLQHTAQRG